MLSLGAGRLAGHDASISPGGLGSRMVSRLWRDGRREGIGARPVEAAVEAAYHDKIGASNGRHDRADCGGG